MYQVRSHTELQVLCQAVSYLIIIVNCHHIYQDQVHQGIQVNHLATIPQGFPLQLLKLSLLNILTLYHHMYQVRYHPELEVLSRS